MAVLGSTGSIGVNTLNIAREFDIYPEVLVAGNNIELLQKQIDEFNPKIVVVGKKEHKDKIKHKKVLWGEEGILEALELCESKLIVNALVGFLGLKPTLKAIELNKEVALANKESLVVAGKFIDTKKITPIDSEHFALWYILNSSQLHSFTASRLIITASGGAFRDWPIDRLKDAKLEDALKHPNWSMGKKITIDSATMVNKLFELIEAKWLFDTKNLDAIIETKSIVHAIVDFVDGGSLMHAAVADMRLPIAYAILKKVEKNIVKNIDFTLVKNLEFRKIDSLRYPIWEIKDLLLQKSDLGVVINAANEVAVEAFINSKINFLKISEIILDSIYAFENVKASSIDDIFIIDKEVRSFAKSLI
ncbi:1-deoxy-D-xylulose-5-phosphate reductoisomerase [Nitrosophilus kaiyonis]|uniref:1-deoxy-D-xylulose-5-phosphate reductoisomerase n=1 Tax=Nitrosophilus kaiyonis TaxID=2930200 RepID=UPI0031E58F05